MIEQVPPELVVAVLITWVIVFMGKWAVDRHWRRKNARTLASAPHRPRLPFATEPEIDEDELIFTHAQVVSELSPEVRAALFGTSAAEPALAEETVWWRGQEHRLRTTLMDGPIGDPEWNVYVGTCSGCGWTLKARSEVLLQRFSAHAEELVPARHQVSRVPFKTKADGRGTKLFCSCGWFQYLTHRDLITPDRCALEHLRECSVRELDRKIESSERWVAQLEQALNLPISAEPVAQVVPLVLRTSEPEKVRRVQFCSHDEKVELRQLDGWSRELCARCGSKWTAPARPTRPSPTTAERRG